MSAHGGERAAADAGAQVFRGGAAVAYADVDAALRSLWRRAAEEVDARHLPEVARVTTLNLIVVAADPTEAAYAVEVTSQLTARHPARVLLLETVPGADAVGAEVSAECHLAGPGRQVCSERVRVLASGEAAGRLPQLVAPLLLPDLHVLLWIPGPPRPEILDADLLALVDRVVVDAREFRDGAAGLELLRAWTAGGLAVVDLAWLRLERWRSLTAQLFDEAPARADLERLSRVEVAYLCGPGGEPEGRVEGMYYLAWIAERLGADLAPVAPSEPRREEFAARRADGGTLELALVCEPRPAGAQGDLSRVGLVAAGRRYEVERLQERRLAEMRLGPEAPCPHVGLPPRETAEMLSAAVAARARDVLFERALVLARRMADAR